MQLKPGIRLESLAVARKTKDSSLCGKRDAYVPVTCGLTPYALQSLEKRNRF